MNELMLFAGLVALTAAFFSFPHPFLRRAGILALGVTTFSAGYLATGNLWIGAACVSAVLLLPWVKSSSACASCVCRCASNCASPRRLPARCSPR
jgi:hypothetical protein